MDENRKAGNAKSNAEDSRSKVKPFLKAKQGRDILEGKGNHM